jgi:hypothetical protein
MVVGMHMARRRVIGFRGFGFGGCYFFGGFHFLGELPRRHGGHGGKTEKRGDWGEDWGVEGWWGISMGVRHLACLNDGGGAHWQTIGNW